MQVVLPILESGVSLAFLSRAVWADVPSSSYPLMHAPVVLPQVSSLHPTPALGARYFFLRVRSLSGHPAGFRLAGWLAVRSTRLIELISMSSSPSCIVPVHPLLAPPVLFCPADSCPSNLWNRRCSTPPTRYNRSHWRHSTLASRDSGEMSSQRS